MSQKLRIGYIPEHFATPLHYAYRKYGLNEHATLISFPSGTGTLIEAFEKDEIDVGIGLTEAWIVGLSKVPQGHDNPYHLVGSYTLSPLTWAISAGKDSSLDSVEDLKGRNVGVSRMGSGSYIMSSVLAQEKGWGSTAFEPVVCGPFALLREAVNTGRADFFMWEHFTTKKWFDDGTLKRVGEIPTPWNAWHIAVRGSSADSRVERFLLPALEQGIQDFKDHEGDAVEFISSNMEYSADDAKAWYRGVVFAEPADLKRLNAEVIEIAIRILEVAGVMETRKITSCAQLQAKQ